MQTNLRMRTHMPNMIARSNFLFSVMNEDKLMGFFWPDNDQECNIRQETQCSSYSEKI